MNKPLEPLRNKSGKTTSRPSTELSAPDRVRNPEITARAHQFASLIRAYYLALVAQGFSPEDALTLTAQYQASMAVLGAQQRAKGEGQEESE